MEKEMKVKLLGSLENVEEGESFRERIWLETKKLWIVAAPGIFTRFSTFGVNIITQAFMGHIGVTELAAFALVYTVLLRFANGILLGMASALQTLCGQAFGAKQYHMLGVYLQRSWIVMLVCTIFLLPIFIFTTPILRLLGQREDIALEAGTISLWFIPTVFSYVFSMTLQNYLQSQSKNMIIAYLATLSLSVHIFLSWLLAVKLELGVAGAMASMILANWIPVVGQLIFIFSGGCKDTWKGFSKSAFKDLWPVVKLSTSSGVMLCLEIWYYTVLVLLTGNMKGSEIAIDALSICLNINGWEMMIAFGFLSAVSVRVANELGRGSAKAAKFSIVYTVVTSLTIGLVLFTFFMVFRRQVAYIFTNSLDVVKAFSSLSPLLAFSILLNSVQPVLSGVAVGSGWQSVVAYVNITCYYVIGIPIGAVLGYVVGLQVNGVWIGMMIGTAIQTLVLVFITVRTDWDQQVTLALARVNKWCLPKDDQYNGSMEVA